MSGLDDAISAATPAAVDASKKPSRVPITLHPG